jgi:hypothetical protein
MSLPPWYRLMEPARGRSGYLAAPLTTKSTSCPSQAEQRKRRAQSVTAVSAPYRAT